MAAGSVNDCAILKTEAVTTTFAERRDQRLPTNRTNYNDVM
jgi:hypothetical protein